MTPALRQVLFGGRAPVVAAVTPTTLNVADKAASVNLSGGNLTAAGTIGHWEAVRSVASASSGKYYFEGTNVVSGSASAIGVGNGSATLDDFPGNNDLNGCSWPSNDTNFYNGGGGHTTGVTWNTAGVGVDVAVDVDNRKIWFRNRGGNWNNDILANQNPATNTGGFALPSPLNSGALFAIVAVNVNGSSITVNFGASAFIDTPPAGFGNLH